MCIGNGTASSPSLEENDVDRVFSSPSTPVFLFLVAQRGNGQTVGAVRSWNSSSGDPATSAPGWRSCKSISDDPLDQDDVVPGGNPFHA